MNMNDFACCKQEHRRDVEYSCIRENKIFCHRCYYQDHAMKCNSSRCGHFERIAHLVIEKVLESKTLFYLSQMSPSYQQYKKWKNQILRLKDSLIFNLKKQVQMKVPLFLHTLLSEVFNTKVQKINNVSYHASDCAEMLKIIKGNSSKSNSLSCSIQRYEKILKSMEQFENKLPNKTYSDRKAEETEKLILDYQHWLKPMFQKLRKDFKKSVEEEVKRTLLKYDNKIQFDGIQLPFQPDFGSSQSYDFSPKNFSLLLEPELERKEGMLYNGFDLTLQKLEKSPESMLEVTKCMLKQKLFNIHKEIKRHKSSFPYKYAYVISTCSEPDQEYQIEVLKLEERIVKGLQKKSDRPFHNSIKIVIMGPELIITELRKITKIECVVRVFGYTEARKQHINQLISELKLQKDQVSIVKQFHPFKSRQQVMSKIFMYFQLIYQHLFANPQSGGDFDDELYLQVQGKKRLKNIIHNWEGNKKISFDIQKDMEDINMLCI